jgi:hypothetical protein
VADGEHTLEDVTALRATAYGVEATALRAEIEETVTLLAREGGLWRRADEDPAERWPGHPPGGR